MTEWGVVGVIVVLIGLIASIIKPILNLNTTIVKLTGIVDNLGSDLTKLTSENTESHRRLWKQVDGHEDLLHEHDKRITVLEEKKGVKK